MPNAHNALPTLRLTAGLLILTLAFCCLAMATPVYAQTSGQPASSPTTTDKAIGVSPIRATQYVGQNRYALVIGINDYSDANIPDLTTCENDAHSLYNLLTQSSAGGIETRNATLLVGKEATTRNIRIALAALRRIPADSTVFVYFSGHGTKEGDEAFWVTQDTELSAVSATALADAEIRRYLNAIPSQRVIVMIDACYAAATIKGGKTVAADFSSVLSKFTGKGRAYLMAAGSGEEAIEARDLKKSVFTHYLIEGLSGEADENSDGVIVLPELTNYIDHHVADEARIRGGVQKPTVFMEEVQEPAKFRLTINEDRLRRNLADTAEAKAARKQRLAKLRELYLQQHLTLDQYQLGQKLLESVQGQLDSIDIKRLKEFVAVTDGHMSSDLLQRALDAIETPAQRAARLALERAVTAAHERTSRIASLLATAKANDSKEKGRVALDALSELLKLDPRHADGLALQAKIAGYFGPSKVGESFTNSIGMKLTYIPADEFMMGSPAGEPDRNGDEQQHRVRLTQPFFMATTEVTQAQWRAVMGNNPSHFKGDNLPVENVSWDDAMAFCAALSKKEGKMYRLPTEAQWEYACRAGTTTAYSTGNGLEALKRAGWGSYDGEFASAKSTKAVGSFRANAWGLYDMHGNVYEWCSDWYGGYPNGNATDPTGMPNGDSRVLRGGSWSCNPGHCRAANRRRDSPDFCYGSFGFRVVSLSAPGL